LQEPCSATTTALLIAQALFHEKEPKEDNQELTPVLEIFHTQLTKHQEKQRAQDQRDNPLSWSRVQWNQFHKKLHAQTVSPVMVPKASNTSQQLAQKGLKDKPQKTAAQIVPSQYHDYLSVFNKKEANQFPSFKPWDHAIELKPDYVPKDCRIYPLSPVEHHLLDNWITEQTRKGYIRQSKSLQASPFFFVGKKDGKLQPCQDYQYINSQTIKNAYPIPLISETINKLQSATYFTKMDVQWGYNNIHIKDGDQWKAAFKTQQGLFEPMVMFFGLCNSPATFQAMMNHLFKDLIDQEVVVVYMDDILIFTRTIEEHQEVTCKVLKILKDNDLYLKPKKCEFEKRKIEYLGLVISENHVAMDLVKVQGILNWPIPKKVKDVQAFIGFCNFYQHFIQGFSDIAWPLTQLTCKEVEWNCVTVFLGP
jgi:hypothetical protein